MKLGRKILYNSFIKRLIILIINFYILLVLYTSSKKTKASKEVEEALAKKGKYIFIFWHSRLMLLTQFIKSHNMNVHSLTSSHSDGDIVAGVVKFFKSDAIRGSSSKNGSTALRQCLKTLANENTILSIAPDGPRGPRMRINSEIVAIAEKTGAYIIPVTYSCKMAKFMNSWDRFMLPIIFNNITYKYGSVYKPQKGDDKKALNKIIEDDLNNITWELDQNYGHEKIDQG